MTFDVFDTAILRTVPHPDDVFALSAWRAVRRHNLSVTPDSLVADRHAAHSAALKAQARLGNAEATIAQIYDNHPIQDAKIRALLLAEELATELDVVKANPDMLAIYDDVTNAGLRAVFLSDTPFASDFLRTLLIAAGYPETVEVHTSSEFGCTKSSGRLFGRIADHLGVGTDHIWHIGDNVRSDVIRARDAGVNPIWYRPVLSKSHPAPRQSASDESLADLAVEGAKITLTRIAQDKSSALRSIGTETAGPVYLAFAQWLMNELSGSDAERVFFLARDSYILKLAYDRLRATASGPPSSYLYVSRRSLVFPMIDTMGDAELDLLCSHEKVLPVGEFISRIGLRIDDFTSQIEAAGLVAAQPIATPDDVAALRALFTMIGPSIIDHARKERALLVRYLDQEAFFDAGAVAICDVGWNGTSQKALAQLRCDRQSDGPMSGYYVGTTEKIEAIGAACGAAKGWLIDRGAAQFGTDFLRLSWVLMELLLSAPHGSTLSYTQAGGKVRPTLRNQSSDSRFQQAVSEIQDGASAFMDTYMRSFGGLPPPAIDEAAATERLARLFSSPTVEEATAIGDLTMIEGLGDTRTGHLIAAPPSRISIVRRPKTFVASYRQASWRRGFVIRVVRSRRVAGAITRLRSGG